MSNTLILLLSVLLGTLVLLGATAISYKRRGEAFQVTDHLLFFSMVFVVFSAIMIFSNKIEVLAAIGFFSTLAGGRVLLEIIKHSKVDELRYPAQGFVGNMSEKGISIAKGVILLICLFGGMIILSIADSTFEKHSTAAYVIAVIMLAGFLLLTWVWSRPKK